MDFGLVKALVGAAPNLMKAAVNKAVNDVSDFVKSAKSKPGDPGYWDPSGLLRSDWWEANVPGISDTARVAQNVTYWQDYKRNTGKSPRYPALQMNGGYIGGLNPMNWWI